MSKYLSWCIAETLAFFITCSFNHSFVPGIWSCVDITYSFVHFVHKVYPFSHWLQVNTTECKFLRINCEFLWMNCRNSEISRKIQPFAAKKRSSHSPGIKVPFLQFNAGFKVLIRRFMQLIRYGVLFRPDRVQLYITITHKQPPTSN